MANWLTDNPVVKPIAEAISIPFKFMGGAWDTLVSTVSAPFKTLGGALEGLKWGPLASFGGFLVGGGVAAVKASQEGKDPVSAFVGEGFQTGLMAGGAAIVAGGAIGAGTNLVSSVAETATKGAQTVGSLVPPNTPNTGQTIQNLANRTKA